MLNNLPKNAKLVTSRAGLWIHLTLTPELTCLTTMLYHIEYDVFRNHRLLWPSETLRSTTQPKLHQSSLFYSTILPAFDIPEFSALPLNNNTNITDLVSINSSIPFIFTFSYHSPLVSTLFLFLLSSSFKLGIIKVIGMLKPFAKKDFAYNSPSTCLNPDSLSG